MYFELDVVKNHQTIPSPKKFCLITQHTIRRWDKEQERVYDSKETLTWKFGREKTQATNLIKGYLLIVKHKPWYWRILHGFSSKANLKMGKVNSEILRRATRKLRVPSGKMSEGIWPMHNDKAIFNCTKGLRLWKKSYDQSWKIGVWSHHVFKNKNRENIRGEI